MTDALLLQSIPDWTAFIQPDGMITHQLGGAGLPLFRGVEVHVGRRLDSLLDDAVGPTLMRLIRRALIVREPCGGQFAVGDDHYAVTLSPQGPERVLCVIRFDAAVTGASSPGFQRLLEDAVAQARLRERGLALAVIYLEGLADVGRSFDFSIRERVLDALLARLNGNGSTHGQGKISVGMLGDARLGIIVADCFDRDTIRNELDVLCAALVQPIPVDGVSFSVQPRAGVAVLGQDASQPDMLIEHAAAAMGEARRAGTCDVQFYSDTMRLLPIMRLDLARELRRAVTDGQIGLTYLPRHDLSSGRVTGINAYMRWVHPLQGAIAPAQFLKIADAVDLAPAVSKAALERLARDLPMLRQRYGADVAISFGALRQHLTSGRLIHDLRALSTAGKFAAGRLELRIAEDTLATLTQPDRLLLEMTAFGARLIVDEVGAGFNSLAVLARLPLCGLQLHRALVVAHHDPVALRACRAVAALARALGVPAIAAGIDNLAVLQCMRHIGCSHGLGDHYPAITPVNSKTPLPQA